MRKTTGDSLPVVFLCNDNPRIPKDPGVLIIE